MEYLDFEVRIAPGSGLEYAVSVVKSPIGEAIGTLRFPFDTLALESQLRGIEIAVLKSGSLRRDIVMAAPEKESVVDFGRQLFNALFAEQVQLAFRRSQDHARMEKKGLRVRLRIDAPDLAALPWEFLYDASSGDYVCLSSDTPVVRYMEFDRPPEPLTVQPPISILAMVASPTDRPGLDVKQERERMEKATAGLQAAGLLKLEWMEGSTWRDLQHTLRRGEYHIFHFVGHGGFDATAGNGGEGVLAFTTEDGRSHLLGATEVARLLAVERSLRLVVLNACLGARGSGTDVFSSTAATLVRAGVPAVVAMQYEISDLAAIEFSRSLYEAIADGMPVDAAVAEARRAVSVSARNSVEWGTPVLHMRSPDGVLFSIDGLTTSVARATGTYRTSPGMASVTAAGAPGMGPPPAAAPAPPQQASSPPPAAFVAPPPVQAPAPSPPPAAVAAPAGGRWSRRNIALAGGGALLAIFLVGKLFGGGSGGGEAVTDGWPVGFTGVQGGDRYWWRIEGSCRWAEMVVSDGPDSAAASVPDTSFIYYVQIAGNEGEVELLDREANVTLFFPRSGGWVSADSADGKGQVNSGVRVTTEWEAVPATGVPECEVPVLK